jgi:hypothetical protein
VIGSFDLNVQTAVDVFPDVLACDSFTLPILTNGNFFSAPGGLDSNWISFGTVLTDSQTVYVYIDTDESCTNESSFNVTIISPFAPTGANNQIVPQGSTLDDLDVTGQNIQWYSSPFGGTPLPNNTQLVNGVTYYASQTIYNGVTCESQFRLPVIVQITLSSNEFDQTKITYSPNPVINVLNIKSSKELNKVTIVNLLGQTIFQLKFNSDELKLDMSGFSSGTYFVIVESDDIKDAFKILKK